jgi:hypothetical protein
MLIWFYMNEMVRDGNPNLKVAKHIDVVLNTIADEVEDGIYEFELNFADESTGLYIPIGKRDAVRGSAFEFVMNQLESFNNTKITNEPVKKPYQIMTLNDQ